MKKLLIVAFMLLISACGGGGSGGPSANEINPSLSAGSGCSKGVTGYYFVTQNDCAAGSLRWGIDYVYQEGSAVSAFISQYATFKGSIDDACNLSLSTNITSSGKTYTYGCTGAWSNRDMNLVCDNVDTKTGNVIGQCAYNTTKIVGGGCEKGIQGHYNAEPKFPSESCVSGSFGISQDGSSLTFHDGTKGQIDNECVFSLTDGSVGVYYAGSIDYLNVDPSDNSECFFTLTPMPVTPKYQIGVFDLTSHVESGCESLSFGESIRLFMTNAYVNLVGSLVDYTGTTQLEADDFGGTVVFSTPFNEDYTMQFNYKDQQVSAKLRQQDLDATLSPSGCHFYYYTSTPNW